MNFQKNNSIKSDQNGFGILEGLLIVIVIGVIAFVGYNVINRQDENVTENITPTTSREEIVDAQGLKQAEDSLGDINLEELDTTELDTAEAELL